MMTGAVEFEFGDNFPISMAHILNNLDQYFFRLKKLFFGKRIEFTEEPKK